jgi:hypothetical protein
VGCSEPSFWDFGTYETTEVFGQTPPAFYPPVEPPQEAISPANAGIVGGIAGLAVGAAGLAAAQQLSRREKGQPKSEEE